MNTARILGAILAIASTWWLLHSLHRLLLERRSRRAWR
jgi:uncharacterized membrane protein YccC